VNSRNFFAELKRRNVYKVAVAYAVVSWLLIQAASILLPTFEAPGWVMKVLVLVIIFGFPVALVFSWAFEITSEGIKLESEIEPNKSIARRTGRKIVAVTIALAVVAAGLFVYQLVRSKSDTPRPSEAATAAPSKSIAVLPFDNLSRDPDNAYFCEGVQDEILTRLAKVADLKVISRTSTQHFKSAPENLPEIARQLGVANILEGSVQKAGDAVRVNVQLIKATSDAHLWADTYDRKLTDIFAVESEIAKSIADALQAKLTGSEKRAIADRPTENTEAYQLYLKGRFFLNKRTGTDLKTAADYFQRAVAADPSYAGACAGLAQADLLIPLFGAGAPRNFFPKAKAAAMRSIELDETSSEGHSTLGMLLCFDFKFPQSEAEFKRAIELNPNDATAHHWFGNALLISLGRFNEAVKEGERAVDLDPLSLIINADLGGDLMLSRRFDEAIAQLRRTLALDANFSYAHWNLGEALYLKGDVTGAIAEYEKAKALDDDPEILGLLGRAYAETGHPEKATEILSKLKETAQHQYVRRYIFALIYIGLGQKETAIQYLEDAFSDNETVDTTWIKVDPALDPLRNEPRFQQLIAKMFPQPAQ
jgi:TolB-like protein/Flp pilus assembly protein TadD